MKDAILERCREHPDKWAQDVEFRVLYAVNDLHAVDARYHKDYKPAFKAPRSVKGVLMSQNPAVKVQAFQAVVSKMEEDMDQLWTSVGVHKLFIDNNGAKLQRWALMEYISTYFGDQIHFLSCPCHPSGFPSLLLVGAHLMSLPETYGAC